MASLNFLDEDREFNEWYSEKYPILRTAEKTVRNLIQLLLADNEVFPAPKIISRLKDKDECISKFKRKYQKQLEKEGVEYSIKDHISDMIGLRVICLYESDIKPIERIIRKSFKVIDVTDKTSELQEKEDRFGYKGLHLDLKFNTKRSQLPEYEKLKDFKFEVQVRTIVQDAWSEIDHKLKYKKHLPSDLKRRVFSLASLFELADREFDEIRKGTRKLEETSKASVKSDSKYDELLNPFDFLSFLQGYFPHYHFHEHRIEEFLDDVKNENPEITFGYLKDAFDNHFSRTEEYRGWCTSNFGKNLNPYTMTRHILYLSSPANFEQILFESAKYRFTRWNVGDKTFLEKYEAVNIPLTKN